MYSVRIMHLLFHLLTAVWVILIVSENFSSRFMYVFTHVVILNVSSSMDFSLSFDNFSLSHWWDEAFCRVLCESLLLTTQQRHRDVTCVTVSITWLSIPVDVWRILRCSSLDAWSIHEIIYVNCLKFIPDEVFRRASRRSRFLSISSNSDWW